MDGGVFFAIAADPDLANLEVELSDLALRVYYKQIEISVPLVWMPGVHAASGKTFKRHNLSQKFNIGWPEMDLAISRGMGGSRDVGVMKAAARAAFQSMIARVSRPPAQALP